jgi:hypothetical protein
LSSDALRRQGSGILEVAAIDESSGRRADRVCRKSPARGRPLRLAFLQTKPARAKPGRRRNYLHGVSTEGIMKFISLRSVAHALKEHKLWSFCAAIATDVPVIVGPNLRML